MIEVELTRGFKALIDERDFPLVSSYQWRAQKNGRTLYAETDVKKSSILMHRLIAAPLPGFQVDHIDGNGLNNLRSNLRLVTSQANNWNRRSPNVKKTSAFKGVDFRNGHWRAQIVGNKKKLHLGAFDLEIEAARAYDAKAKELFGPFARLNFPEAA